MSEIKSQTRNQKENHNASSWELKDSTICESSDLLRNPTYNESANPMLNKHQEQWCLCEAYLSSLVLISSYALSHHILRKHVSVQMNRASPFWLDVYRVRCGKTCGRDTKRRDTIFIIKKETDFKKETDTDQDQQKNQSLLPIDSRIKPQTVHQQWC